MAYELVGGFNSAASNGITSYPVPAIMYSFPVVIQIDDQFADFFLGLTVFGVHSSEPTDYIADLGKKQSGNRVLYPFYSLE